MAIRRKACRKCELCENLYSDDEENRGVKTFRACWKIDVNEKERCVYKSARGFEGLKEVIPQGGRRGSEPVKERYAATAVITLRFARTTRTFYHCFDIHTYIYICIYKCMYILAQSVSGSSSKCL